ncbi:MAG: RsmB/NOP family class I SAM-dependent RNA methyltransferase [Alphaproteobacteria bacterium]|nr:RsmB/NOP family class I SAM-dependent RNA methyltransferase [Alphaproteobacteria bacterium]MBV9693724.1 RsmB/NOP family class I SAM-dependent RNA methyltransferase [Alphaproteobacteria bacterium]
MTPAARLQAVIDILGAIEGTAKPVERLLRDWGRSHRFAGSKDRAAIADSLYAILRRKSEFAWRMGSDGPRALAIALAAEQGDAATLFAGAGYGPAALSDEERDALAHAPSADPPLHVQGEYPQFLESELKRAFGENVLSEMGALKDRAPVDLRVNTLKAQRDAVLHDLQSSGYDAEPTPHSPLGIRLAPGTKNLERAALFLSGAFEFQDEAAQLAVLLCEARPGMRVLDLAAGAGGKSLALAAEMQNRGEIAACDVRAEALDELQRRATRAGATIIKNLPLPQEVGGEGKNLFDIVLLDAPCSGTGTWRRQPELRWRLTPERLSELMAIQDRLLAQAAWHVRPGGRLVYATCSILPCENDDRIAAFLDVLPKFAATGQELRLSPYATGTDGFFASVLARKGP